MSMNLHCSQVNLLQTPTHITYMCYSNNDGGWKGIRYRYLQWVMSHCNGAFKNRKEADDVRAIYTAHRDLVMSYEKLDFDIV